jgi:hypothetical protein
MLRTSREIKREAARVYSVTCDCGSRYTLRAGRTVACGSCGLVHQLIGDGDGIRFAVSLPKDWPIGQWRAVTVSHRVEGVAECE